MCPAHGKGVPLIGGVCGEIPNIEEGQRFRKTNSHAFRIRMRAIPLESFFRSLSNPLWHNISYGIEQFRELRMRKVQENQRLENNRNRFIYFSASTVILFLPSPTY